MSTIINIVNGLQVLHGLTIMRIDIQRVSLKENSWYVGYVDIKDHEGNCSRIRVFDNGIIELVED